MNCKSKLLCIIALLLPLAVHATNGTLTVNSAGEYEVADYADLKVVGMGSYALDTTYRLTANIDASPSATENSGAGFLPIGTFTGKFHGGGHAINNLTINYESSNAGLFSTVESTGLVDSLGLGNVNVTGFQYVGTIAAINKGTIRTCYATGVVHMNKYFENLTGSSVYTYAGGSVGYNFGTIAECFADVAVSASLVANNSSVYDMVVTVGGFVGASNGTISNSYATGAVSSISKSYLPLGNPPSAMANAFGRIESGTVSESYATGTVSASATYKTSSYAGQDGAFDGNSGVTACYFNQSKVTPSYTDAGSGLTDAQMLQSANFSSWDFAGTWYQYNGKGYPLLRAFLKPVTVKAADSVKTYDGVAFSGGALSYSLANMDTSLVQGSVTFAGSAQGKINVGKYSLIINTFDLYSTQLGYLIKKSTDAGSLQINPKALTLAGLTASNKVYDGTLAAALSGTATLNVNELSNNTQDVAFAGTGSAHFLDKNTGLSKPVVVTGISLTGADISNYSIDTFLIANITARPTTITGVTASDKIYDGNTSAVLSGGTLDAITGDDVTLNVGIGSFSDANVGTAKAVTASGYSITGTDANNYTLSVQPTSITASITAYPITVTADAKSITQGDSNVPLTYTATPLLASDSWAGELARIAGDSADTYAIMQGTLNAGLNYAITFNGADYVIHAKPPVALLPIRNKGLQGFSIAHQSGDVLDVTYNTPFAGNVSIEFYSLRGKKMLTVNYGMQNVGTYSANVQTNTMPVGLYTATLRVNRVSISTIKLVKN